MKIRVCPCDQRPSQSTVPETKPVYVKIYGAHQLHAIEESSITFYSRERQSSSTHSVTVLTSHPSKSRITYPRSRRVEPIHATRERGHHSLALEKTCIISYFWKVLSPYARPRTELPAPRHRENLHSFVIS